MKRIAITILLMISFGCSSQPRIPQRTISQTQAHNSNFEHRIGDYINDAENRLNLYEGTWIYNDNNGTIFTIKLEKKLEILSELRVDYSFYDMIILRYKLIKNGVVLFDNLNDALPDHILSRDEEGVFGYFNFVESYERLLGSFTDYNYNIVANCLLTKLNTPAGNPEKIKITLFGGVTYNDYEFYQNLPSSFSVPNNVELVKQ